MGDRASKDALFDALARAARALGSGRRAELVDVLAQGERSVDDLAREIEQSIANTSRHLQVLAGAGLVTSRRAGTRVIYSLASERVQDLWATLRDVADLHVAGLGTLVDGYLGQRDGIDEIPRDELAARLGDDDLLVLDVRPEAEYRAAHIPSAESLPPERLRERLAALPDDVDVVAYCRGAYCVYAVDAIRALAAEGRAARRLEEGFPEWRRAGLPVETVG